MIQENIVTCLSLKTSTEELESYCMLWSLHPYIDDEVMHEAWSLINQPYYVLRERKVRDIIVLQQTYMQLCTRDKEGDLNGSS